MDIIDLIIESPSGEEEGSPAISKFTFMSEHQAAQPKGLSCISKGPTVPSADAAVLPTLTDSSYHPTAHQYKACHQTGQAWLLFPFFS